MPLHREGQRGAGADRSEPRHRDGKGEKIDVSKVDVSMNGIELQDRESFAAIREGREPNASVAQVLPSYEVLHQLEEKLS
jgi:2-hydroxy-4-carboxymuconate semialdehyde hemiacetal dehydrogenase